MAKTAKLKKKQAAPHSRAARRAASPSIPVPSVKTPRSSSPNPSTAAPHILSARPAGISKRKTAKTTRAQRVRAEKAMDRAADDMDKWALKKARSIVKAGRIKERAKVWDEVNGESVSVKRKGDLGGTAEEKLRKESVWVDVEGGDVEGDVDVEDADVDLQESVQPAVDEDELL